MVGHRLRLDTIMVFTASTLVLVSSSMLSCSSYVTPTTTHRTRTYYGPIRDGTAARTRSSTGYFGVPADTNDKIATSRGGVALSMVELPLENIVVTGLIYGAVLALTVRESEPEAFAGVTNKISSLQKKTKTKTKNTTEKKTETTANRRNDAVVVVKEEEENEGAAKEEVKTTTTKTEKKARSLPTVFGGLASKLESLTKTAPKDDSAESSTTSAVSSDMVVEQHQEEHSSAPVDVGEESEPVVAGLVEEEESEPTTPPPPSVEEEEETEQVVAIPQMDIADAKKRVASTLTGEEEKSRLLQQNAAEEEEEEEMEHDVVEETTPDIEQGRPEPTSDSVEETKKVKKKGFFHRVKRIAKKIIMPWRKFSDIQ